MGYSTRLSKLNEKYFQSIVSYLFVLLFVYAATSKIMDFDTFKVQLAQSPLLSAYAGLIAWLVPAIELMVTGFLLIPRLNRLGLFSSYLLMVMFTAYIYIILNFSDFIPCSCGGVLEKLSWTQHLIFNLVFILLAIVAILFARDNQVKKKLILLFGIAVLGIGVVVILFIFSEEKMQRNNAFLRRYPHHPANEIKRLDIKYNSYYFAGISQDKIYLGNTSAPLHLLIVEKNVKDTIHRTVRLVNDSLGFRSLKIQIEDSIFYISDGNVPAIIKGKSSHLIADNIIYNREQFIKAENISNDNFVIRVFDNKTTANVLGTLHLNDSVALKLAPNLLKFDKDAFFDTDGLLLYNKYLQKIIYVYFYRNEFLVIRKDLSHEYIGKTIDTISQANLDIRNISSRGEKKLGKNPIFVNLRAATFGKYLLIQSDRLGKYESEDMLKSASIIDVYDLEKQIYSFSFYLYHQGLEKLHEFKVFNMQLYALIDHYLIIYDLNKENFIP